MRFFPRSEGMLIKLEYIHTYTILVYIVYANHILWYRTTFSNYFLILIALITIRIQFTNIDAKIKIFQ